MHTRRSRFSGPSILGAALALSGLLAAGCGSSNQASDAAVGGPVSGALDNHCAAVTPIIVSQASCHPAGSGTDDGSTDEESPVLYNAAGDDDDCKYHVSFTSTPVRLNQNVAFNVTATLLDPGANGAPATGANIQIESYMADNPLQLIPNTGVTTAETPAGSGVYKISPVRFPMSGQWVVRFHLYEDCADLNDDSPHGHIAFLLDVP